MFALGPPRDDQSPVRPQNQPDSRVEALEIRSHLSADPEVAVDAAVSEVQSRLEAQRAIEAESVPQ